MKLTIDKWNDHRFQRVLNETLSQYPTGKEVDLDEVVEYHRTIPKHKIVPEVFEEARNHGRTLLNPRAGVADLEEMIDLLLTLQDAGGADLLPINPDSYTRTEQFEKAKTGLEASIAAGRSLLNGFPVVAHGVKNCRKLFEAVDRPIVTRSVTPRARLLCTMVIASGITEICVGALSNLLCMEYDLPVEYSIENAQYLGRLVGRLNERGIKIAIESVTTAAAGTLSSPSIAIVSGIVDSLILAYQGAGYLSVAFPPMHNFVQDIAGLRTQRRLTRDYLDRFGFKDAVLSQNLHQWNGPFPACKHSSLGLIAVISSIASMYGEAEQMMVKTGEEGLGVPSKEANVEGLILCRQVMNLLRGQKLPDSEEIREESRFIEMEAKSILNKIEEFGEGDILQGALKALELGVYEYPYGVSKHTLGKVTLIRDAAGAVRFHDIGNLPFSPEIVEYHRDKIEQRKALENREEYLMMIDDIREVRAFLK